MKIKQLVKQKPKQTLPMADIMGYYNQLVGLQNSKSVMVHFLNNSIENFMAKYGDRVETAFTKLGEINDKYLKEQDGKFLKAPNGDPIIKELYSVEDYNKEVEPILNEQIEFML